MDALRNNRDLILDIKNQVERLDDSLFRHSVVENTPLDEEKAISVVMTSHNRSKQVYFTLKTLSDSSVKHVQVVLVDDSTHDPVDIERLRAFPFYIDFVQVRRDNKKWHNPCVNYNLGFRFVRGSKVVIQNSEVCHVGDVLQFVRDHVHDNRYYVLDVKASKNYETNEVISNSDVSDTRIFQQEHLFDKWYQSASNNRRYHFLAACARETFDKIGGFSYDYSMGSCYDDDDFVLKIMSLGIPIISKFHTETDCLVGGIHQFHGIANDINGWDHAEYNDPIFRYKQHHYSTIGKYIDLL
jgi:glycosyltransferase involved in cell wall biosynthesis